MSERQPRNRPLSIAGKTVVILFICAGIAFLGVLRADNTAVARRGTDPLAGYYDETMPRYPGTVELPAGPSTWIGGAQTRMSTFETADEPLKVARFYAERWKAAGLYLREEITHKGGVVSGVDPKSKQVYQILLERNGGSTRVFPSVTSSPLAAMETGRFPPPVPLYPKSIAILSMQSNDVGRAARIVMSQNSGSLDENLAHYRRALAGAGYQEQHKKFNKIKELAPGYGLLVMFKSGSEVTVSMMASGDSTGVHITEVRSGR